MSETDSSVNQGSAAAAIPVSQPILPGETLGIMGGGQLGRMFAIAARRMGYRVHSLDPTKDCPTGQVADREVVAPYDDVDAARVFADGVRVVTFEFENIPAETLEALEALRPVRPSPKALDTCRHRLREKRFLSGAGFPVAPFREVDSEEGLRQALEDLGTPAILKTAAFGYDGKGQVRINDISETAKAWESLNCLAVLEQVVPFAKEISVIVARGLDGQTRCFDVAENDHRNHILDVTTVPARVTDATAKAALELGQSIANELDLVGVMAIEMFLVGDDKLVVNELAPRPHNSGHFSFDACVTSQFEQQLRAVCGLPLGDPALLRPVAMANLLGDEWFDADGNERQPNWAAALTHPDLKLHLYGKAQPRKGRKMGHLTAMADTAEEARKIVLDARQRLAE